jgi:hypothetical protein
MYDFAEYDYYDFQDAQEMQDAFDDGWEYEDDGQPSEYEEWQDYMGGDDWDFGQFDQYEDY